MGVRFELARLCEWRYPTEAAARRAASPDGVRLACPACGLAYDAVIPARLDTPELIEAGVLAEELLRAECPDHPAHFGVG